MLAHACNPNTWEAEEEDSEFKVSLGHTVNSYLQKSVLYEMSVLGLR
jgi:hypothetical protein